MVERAEIYEKDRQSSAVKFQFNPESISFTKSATWQEQETQSAESAPVRQFGGAGAIELSLKLLLDDTIEGGSSVADRVNRLASWTNPKEESRESKPEPATLVFNWGRFSIGVNRQFECHLKSVGVDYTMFSPEGIPLRANCEVKLIGTGSISWGQNPTSGGREAARSTLVAPDDSLAALSQRHYGTPNRWRDVAEFNDIDNPFTLVIGSELVIPRKARNRTDG